MAARRQAFQAIPELQQFVLPDVRPTGRQLGVGSYGSVEEVEVNRLVCAGKRLHDALVEQGNAGVTSISSKYLQECQVMAKMRHPHVVQFLGLCFLDGSTLPVLVMEKLDSSLDDLLESTPGLPLTLKQSVLVDIVQGLLYLHTRVPPIVHRDLTARNILLTSSLVAKISDLGNARIVNLRPGQLAKTLTRLPGTAVYMPPEAFDERSKYGPRLDIFSFGHLTLFTLTQVFPETLLTHTYVDPENPHRLLGRSEVERRWEYVQSLHRQLGEQHPLVQVVHQCLHNTPSKRPSAEELLPQLEAARVDIEGHYNSQLKKVDVVKVGMMKALREIGNLQEQLQRLELEQVEQARDTETRSVRLQEKDAEIERQQRELQTLREDNRQLLTEVEGKDNQIQQKEAQLQLQDGQLQRQAVELVERTTQLHRLQRDLQVLTEERGRLHGQLQRQAQEKDTEINRLQEEMVWLQGQLRRQAQEKDAEINRLQVELQVLTDQSATRDERVAAERPPFQTEQRVQGRPPSRLRSVASLENARYRLDMNPTSDHPNEDRHFAMQGDNFLSFGVFDGHDGPKAAGFASNYIVEVLSSPSWHRIEASDIPLALREVFQTIDKEFFRSMKSRIDEMEALQSVIPPGMMSYRAYQLYPVQLARLQEIKPKIAGGCTAVVAVVSNNHLFVANVGNSRAILIYEKANGSLATEQLTVDHTVENEDEIRRLEALGLDRTQLEKAGQLGGQENTRSIGDYYVKAGYKNVDSLRHAAGIPGTAKPFVMPPRAIDSSFRYLVLMSAGVYKTVVEPFVNHHSIDPNKVLVGIISSVLSKNPNLEEVADAVVDRIAKIHMDTYQRAARQDVRSPVAMACRTRDDMTLLVFKFF